MSDTTTARKRGGKGGTPLQPIPHGTASGYRAHYRRKELPACEACVKASTAAEAIRRRKPRPSHGLGPGQWVPNGRGVLRWVPDQSSESATRRPQRVA